MGRKESNQTKQTKQLASVQIREMWQLGKDMIMYPPAYNNQGVADQRLIGTRTASQGVRHDQSANSFLPYCRYAGIVLLEEKIVSKSLINLQNMWVKDFIYIALACK